MEDMASNPAVSLDMLAKRAGVSKATVSRALNNRSRISPDTKERILKLAEEMGYIPDARLTELMHHLRRRKQGRDKPVLALLYSSVEGLDYSAKGGRNVINGIVQRIHDIGYTLDYFNLKSDEMTPARISQIMWNRGIEGVLVHPLERPHELNGLHWHKFCWVAVGYSILGPLMNRVAIDYKQVVWMAVTKCLEDKRRRIGLFTTPNLNERTMHHYRCSWLGYRDLVPDQLSPFLICSFDEEEKIRTWITEQKLDTVLAPGDGTTERITQVIDTMGLQIKVVNLSVSNPEQCAEGVYLDDIELGKMAVDFLVQQIQTKQKGLPQYPKTIMVSGVWINSDFSRQITW